VTVDLRPSEADVRMLRRATMAVAAQTAAAVAATIVVVSVIAFSLTIRSDDAAQERLVRQAAATADDVTDPPAGVVLIRLVPGNPPQVSPGTPDELASLDPRALPAGRSHIRRDGRDYEVYVADAPGGIRTLALLDVTSRTQAGRRLVGSLAAAAVVGVLVAALVGVVVGRRAVRPLGRALALQRRFVADVSHELRTPLAVLHTRAQLIQRRFGRVDGRDRRLQEHVDQLVADTRALGEVVEDLLRSAELRHRADAGTPVDLGQLARELVASVRPHAATLQVDLVADVDPDGPLTVIGIRSSLRRALAALVDNALAHEHPGGTVTVRVRPSGAAVELAVIDDGEGLDAAEAERLLARHAQGASADRDKPRLGLGLALVREVLAAHGGSLAVAGRPGEGATFTMTLPATGAE
jgi:signal transduction histidine kinase